MKRIKELSKKYNISNDSNIEKYFKDGRIYFKRKSVMNLPAFCLYILRADSLEWPDTVGWDTVKTTIPGEFFRDFADHKTREEINCLSFDKQPSVVVIHDFNAFKERLISCLHTLGIDDSEILIKAVTYYDFFQYGITGWFDLNRTPPLELAVKNSSFSNQSEARFIINSKNQVASDYLRNNAIELGSLSDIATIVDGYFSEGLEFSCKVKMASFDRE